MNNTSKVLIIAGAILILILILIVGLGVIIYSNVASKPQVGTLDQSQISSHNSPFESYFCDYVSGTNVKDLLSKVQVNNNEAIANGEEFGNYIYVIDVSGNNFTSTDVKTERTYKVHIGEEGFDDTLTNTVDGGKTTDKKAFWRNGFIKTIIIEENET